MELSCINIKFACNCDLTKLQENVSLKKKKKKEKKRKENRNTVAIRPRQTRRKQWDRLGEGEEVVPGGQRRPRSCVISMSA